MSSDGADLYDPADFPEEGGPGDTLNQSESLDSDEVRNDDGDIVVDPPEGWSEANRFGVTAREQQEGESLDARLAEEEPDVLDEVLDPVPEDEPDAGPDDGPPGRADHGQVSGTPEDGESLYQVVDQ